MLWAYSWRTKSVRAAKYGLSNSPPMCLFHDSSIFTFIVVAFAVVADVWPAAVLIPAAAATHLQSYAFYRTMRHVVAA